jgi:hypothetical protein
MRSIGKKSLAALLDWCHVFATAMRKAIAIVSFRNQAIRRAWAVVCLAFFLALLLFTSSHRLHKLIHPDADSPDHECGVTMLVHGQVNTLAVPPILIVFIATLFFSLALLQSKIFSSFEYRFCPSRAPPLR